MTYARKDTTWLIKKYTLFGDIDLSYQDRWIEENPFADVEKFNQTYSLGVGGYVLDPRIMYFRTQGFYTHEEFLNDGSQEFNGFDARVILLSGVLNRGIMNFVPKPVNLWYATYDSETQESENYGIGLVFRRRGDAIRFFSRGKLISVGPYKDKLYYNNFNNFNNYNNNSNVSNGFKIPFPELYFDYNRNERRNKIRTGYDSETDNYSYRLYMLGKENRLQAEYTQRSTGRGYELDWDYLTIDHTFRRTQPRGLYYLDINNRYAYEKTDTFSRTTERQTLSSATTWFSKVGTDDSYKISPGFRYSDIDDSSTYNGILGVSYNAKLSKNLTNSTGVFGSYSDGDDIDDYHSEGVTNSITLYLPRRTSVFQTLSVTNTESGVNYGFLLGAEGAKIRAYLGQYSYDVINVGDVQNVVHRYYGRVTGPIVRKFSFLTSAEYRLTHTDDGAGSVDERVFSYMLDLFWNYARGRLAVGGIYDDIKRENGASEEGSVTTLYLNGSYRFARGLYATLLASWRENLAHETRTAMQPRLYWTLRKLKISAEYDYIHDEKLNLEATEHRIFFRLVRYFSRDLYF